jgi:hypothetical protein
MNDFVGNSFDTRFLSVAGWDQTSQSSENYKWFFCRDNVNYISAEITRLLAGSGYQVRVTDEVIAGVMSNVAQNNNPVVGDIFTRYVVPNKTARDDIVNMNQQVITVIVNTILNEMETTKLNQRLSIWSTVYGDFNTEGLRAHSIIRKKENDYIKGVFSMNY